MQGDNVLDLNSADARFVALARVLNPQLSFGSLVSDSSYSSHNQRRNGIRSILSLDDENHCHDEQKRPMLFKDFDTFDYESGLFRQAFDKSNFPVCSFSIADQMFGLRFGNKTLMDLFHYVPLVFVFICKSPLSQSEALILHTVCRKLVENNSPNTTRRN